MPTQEDFDKATAAAADASRANFRQYLQWNRREFDKLALDDSRKFSTDLYVVTAELAPSRSEIAADVRRQGWKIPRRFPDGRMGRGVAAQWLGSAWARKKPVRGRPSKKRLFTQEEFMAQKPTLQQMQQFVIAERTSHRLYLASGWLGSIIDLGGSVKATSGAVDRSRGGANIRRSPGILRVEFWNRTPGIAIMQDKTDFLGRAVNRRIADRDTYIARKQKEAADMMRSAA